MQQFAGFVDRQLATMVGQGMQDNDRIGTRFDHFVEIADRAFAHGARQRAVMPDGAVVVNEITADEIAGREVVVAGDADQRPLQAPGHVLNEPRFAGAGRAFQHDRQLLRGAGLKQRDLLRLWQIEGRWSWGFWCRRSQGGVAFSGAH